MSGYLLTIIVGVAQLALGITVGVWLMSRRASKPIRTEGWVRELAGRFQSVASNMVEHVDEYRTRIEATSQKLASADRSRANAPELVGTVVGIVDEMLDLNSTLHVRLAKAEGQLQLQSEQIDSYLSEARTDGLTSLLNRRALDEELRRRLATWQRHGNVTSFMLVDVDYFKKLNDQHGHPAGDAVLQALAEILTETTRELDVVARYGGEEFAVVLPETDLHQAKIAGERVRAAVESHVFRHGGMELRVTVSVGLAELTTGDDLGMWIGRADQALYAAKKAGRNCACYHDGRMCHPVLAPALPVDPEVVARWATPPATNVTIEGELADACYGVRARLAEVVSRE